MIKMHHIDSHTEGEPTRVILSGGPDLGEGSLKERRDRFAEQFDEWRTAIVSEPRGAEALVGALLCKPTDPSCAAGVIFFNGAGYLGMCGHATMGLAVSLHHAGRLEMGKHRIETPVGFVVVNLLSENEVQIENVPSYRYRKAVKVGVAGAGVVSGDVAWGGNWFFLVKNAPFPLEPAFIPQLAASAKGIRLALASQEISGPEGELIDHVEFFGCPSSPKANSKSFVLCPDGAYDRSPCGTGTSAKVACLAGDGQLAPGKVWIQESILGSRFEANYRLGARGEVIPSITGRAYVTGEGTLFRSPSDPFANGITPVSCSTLAEAR